jgi:hypothetical protein
MNFRTDRTFKGCPPPQKADISQVKSDAVPWLPAQITSTRPPTLHRDHPGLAKLASAKCVLRVIFDDWAPEAGGPLWPLIAAECRDEALGHEGRPTGFFSRLVYSNQLHHFGREVLCAQTSAKIAGPGFRVLQGLVHSSINSLCGNCQIWLVVTAGHPIE